MGARWLESDVLSNQDISNALAIGAYTADADRLILVQFFADQVAGNGDYVFYVKVQLGGSGSAYTIIPITTGAAASGVTAIGGQSGMIAVRSGDVVTVYLGGLAGDNANPDTTVRWFELAALQPTTPDRRADVAADGTVGIDWSNVGSPSTSVNLSGTTVKTATDVETDIADIQTQIGTAGAGLTALPWNAAWDAEVQSEATDALNAYDPPTNAEMEARTLPAANYFDPAADTVVNVTTVATVNALGTDAVSAAALAAGAVDEILDEVVEGSITLRQAIRIILARLVNKASGGGTTTLTFRDVADSKPRVTMTVDADGNRSAVTLDGA